MSNGAESKWCDSIPHPAPKMYFTHLVDHVERFVAFLETTALRWWGQTICINDDANRPANGKKEDMPVGKAANDQRDDEPWVDKGENVRGG